MLLFLTALDVLFERRTERARARPATTTTILRSFRWPRRAGRSRRAGDHDPALSAKTRPRAYADDPCRHAGGPRHAAGLFALADPIARCLGRTGTMVVTRLFGMLLAALSIQFVIDGLKGSGLF